MSTGDVTVDTQALSDHLRGFARCFRVGIVPRGFDLLVECLDAAADTIAEVDALRDENLRHKGWTTDARAERDAARAEAARLRDEFAAMADLHDAKHRDWQDSEAEVATAREAERFAVERWQVAREDAEKARAENAAFKARPDSVAPILGLMRERDAARAEVTRLRAALVEIASTGTLSASTAAKYHAIARAALGEGT